MVELVNYGWSSRNNDWRNPFKDGPCRGNACDPQTCRSVMGAPGSL